MKNHEKFEEKMDEVNDGIVRIAHFVLMFTSSVGIAYYVYLFLISEFGLSSEVSTVFSTFVYIMSTTLLIGVVRKGTPYLILLTWFLVSLAIVLITFEVS